MSDIKKLNGQFMTICILKNNNQLGCFSVLLLLEMLVPENFRDEITFVTNSDVCICAIKNKNKIRCWGKCA